MKKFLSLVLLSLTIGACGKSPVQPTAQPLINPAPQPPGEALAISGIVTRGADDGGGTVEGAVVSVGDDFDVYASTTTDIEGRFSLSGLGAGIWQLTVSKDGFETTTMLIDLAEDMAVEVEINFN